MPVVHFPCPNVSALEEANMRDPPLCHERFRVCAAQAARRSAFYHQNPFPPMLPIGDKSGWNSDYSSLREHLRKWEMAE